MAGRAKSAKPEAPVAAGVGASKGARRTKAAGPRTRNATARPAASAASSAATATATPAPTVTTAAAVQPATASKNGHRKKGDAKAKIVPGAKLDRKFYEKELAKLDVELNRLQEWIRHAGLKIVILFEGRDAAGKGGTIKTISASLNPRICRVVALGTPSDRQKTQWYFQRYVEHLPAAGEMVLFDRSWYNRAGVERVMGFCSEEEYREFMRSAPEFERMLQRSGITVIKYWFSVSDDEQERRFQARIDDPTKRWKLSPMDLQSRTRWVDYSRAKDEMFAHTDTKTTPWYVVQADDKRRARLNTIKHLLNMIPYGDVPQQRIKLPRRQSDVGYVRPPVTTQTFVPDDYGG